MTELFANSRDPDQTPHFAASDLGLHCLPITLLGVSRYNGLRGKDMLSGDNPVKCFCLPSERHLL